MKAEFFKAVCPLEMENEEAVKRIRAYIDWGHGSNQGIKGRRSKRSTLSAARLHGDYNGSSCTA